MYLYICTEQMRYLGRFTKKVHTIITEWSAYTAMKGTHWDTCRMATSLTEQNNPLIRNIRK